MLAWIKDLLWSPASFKEAVTHLVLGVMASAAVLANTGEPKNWQQWATVGMAFVAGWAKSNGKR